MQSPTPAGQTAFANQKLPTEIIGIICGFVDFETHTTIRATCASVRLYVPLRKVVGFEEYKKLMELYKIIFWWGTKENESRRVFQERIHLDLYHETLTQYQVYYLQIQNLDYELCRIARIVLDHPESYKGIDLLFKGCYILAAVTYVGDIELLIRLLQVPLMDPAASDNRAIVYVACFGRLEIFQLLLQYPRVDPSARDNDASIWAAKKGHLDLAKALLQDPRVDPSDGDNSAIKWAAQNGHHTVVRALLEDSRVAPPASDNNEMGSLRF